ncbi:MAG: single-stranded DNA-binding protein [Candidatus Hydrogenedentota bacterium]
MADLRIPQINSVFLAGRLTADPELRYTPNNVAVCKMRIAVTRYYRSKEGERREDTLFTRVTCFDKSAEYCNEYLRKGRPVYVEGRLNSFDFEDRDTGQKRTMIEVVAQRVEPLDWDDRQGGGGAPRSESAAPRSEGASGRPQPRPIEEPIPEDDIPF